MSNKPIVSFDDSLAQPVLESDKSMNTPIYKPCGNCSSTDLRVLGVLVTFAVHCNNCGSNGPLKYSHDDAIIAWNHRPRESDLYEALRIAERCMSRYGISTIESLSDHMFFDHALTTTRNLLTKHKKEQKR